MAIVAVIICSFQKPTPPRTYILQGDIHFYATLYNNIQKAKEAILQSDLPVKEASPLLDTLNGFQTQIAYQIKFQDSVYNASEKKDTSKSKK